MQHSGGADVLSLESFLLTRFSQDGRRTFEATICCIKSTGLLGLLPSHVQALGVSWNRGTNKKVAQSEHKPPCADPSSPKMPQHILGPCHGKEMAIWERQSYSLLMLVLSGFCRAANTRVSSWPPALFDQQGSCSAYAAEDLPTPPDSLQTAESYPSSQGQCVRSYW